MTLSSSPRRRLTPAARRAEILQTAGRLISERGYRGVSVQEIADVCGMAKAGLMHHFPTKTDLLVALLETLDAKELARAEQSMEQGDLDWEAASRLIQSVVEKNLQHPEILRLFVVLGTEALEPNHPAHAYFQERLARARAAFRQGLQGWHPDPDHAALQCIAYLDGLYLLWLRDSDVPIRQLWTMFLEQLIQHARTPEGAVRPEL